MPFLARLVVAAAMLTSGWVNCFSQVEIRPGIAAGLRSMDVEVREQGPEVPLGSERGWFGFSIATLRLRQAVWGRSERFLSEKPDEGNI